MVAPHEGAGELVRSLVLVPLSGSDEYANPILLDLSKVSSSAASVPVPTTIPPALYRNRPLQSPLSSSTLSTTHLQPKPLHQNNNKRINDQKPNNCSNNKNPNNSNNNNTTNNNINNNQTNNNSNSGRKSSSNITNSILDKMPKFIPLSITSAFKRKSIEELNDILNTQRNHLPSNKKIKTFQFGTSSQYRLNLYYFSIEELQMELNELIDDNNYLKNQINKTNNECIPSTYDSLLSDISSAELQMELYSLRGGNVDLKRWLKKHNEKKDDKKNNDNNTESVLLLKKQIYIQEEIFKNQADKYCTLLEKLINTYKEILNTKYQHIIQNNNNVSTFSFPYVMNNNHAFQLRQQRVEE